MQQQVVDVESPPKAADVSELDIDQFRAKARKEAAGRTLDNQGPTYTFVDGAVWAFKLLALSLTTDSFIDFPSIEQIIWATDILAHYGVTPEVYKEHYEKGLKPASATDGGGE